MKKIVIPGLLITVLVLIGTAVVTINNQQTKPTIQNNRQTTPRAPLEEFLKGNNAGSEVAEAYRFALENPQNVLSQVRCYCGCIQNQGHKNNRDCFITQRVTGSGATIDEDGSFNLMGLNCGLCVKTALSAKQMLSEGKTVEEISNYVDSKWGKN